MRERWRGKRNDRQAELEWQVQGNAVEIERRRAQNEGIRMARNGGLDDVACRVDDCLQRIEVRVEVERSECGDSAHNGRIRKISFAEHRRESLPRSVCKPVVTARQVGDQRRQASNEISDPFSSQRARRRQLLESVKVVLAQTCRKHVS